MKKHSFYSFILAGLLGGFSFASPALANSEQPPGGEPAVAVASVKQAVSAPPGISGSFLASHFAQSRYDWKTAGSYLDKVLRKDAENPDLIKRAMVLATGAGDMTQATARARDLLKVDPYNSLAIMILGVDALANNHPEQALAEMNRMPDGDITDFIRPLIRGWAKAAQGVLDTSDFNVTTIHSYNGALMALYLNRKNEVPAFIQRMIEQGAMPTYDAERAGDLFATIGDKQKALSIFEGTYQQGKNNKNLEKKIAALKDDDAAALKELIPALAIKTPAQGAAVAMFDMARILFQEDSDSSARLFANMALALNPEFLEARILLASNMARNGQFDEAIGFFSAVKRGQANYLDIQHYVADLLADSKREQEALTLLERLFAEDHDIDALIRIGDIYRNDESYDQALTAYNRAAQAIGGKVPEEYWYLLYARGMTYERKGDWPAAEADLKAAIAYRPDHPYLLNYLGYSWADKGINLDESLGLLKKAAELRPTDGYITDSLGWALFMMKRYEEAVPSLEKAVEILPYDATLNDHLGDAYWQVSRRTEARFQWERALSNTTDEAQAEALRTKLSRDFRGRSSLKEAKSGVVDTSAQ